MRSKGLLEHATALRRQRRPQSRHAPSSAVFQKPAKAPREAEITGDEGITAEDREEILATIAGLSRGNKLAVGGDVMLLRPRRKGFVFPLVINIAAVVLIIGGLLGLSLLFASRQARYKEGQSLVATAEGKLIQEIKKDSDSKLREKDLAIADIQGRLSSVDRQRSALAAGFEDRVKAKEAEFKTALQVELEKERKRLAALGLSEDAIKERLKKFEAEKNAEFDKELAAFRKQADAEKAAKDSELAGLRAEYQKSISSLNGERKKIQDDADQKEETLRASLDLKAKDLEVQTVQAKAGMEKAKAELARLQDQKSAVQSAEDRILGLYAGIRSALRDRRFDDAASGATALSAYLNEPTVVAMPALQGRRDADLFIADALGSLARSELAQASADTNLLLRQAELLASAKASVAAAEKALGAGDQAGAQAKYQEALASVPEILAAHAYFIDKASAEEAARVAKLNDSLAAAERAFKLGDIAGASVRYSEALSYLPIDERARSAMTQRFAQAGAAEADKAKRAADTKAAREGFEAARGRLAAGAWQEAITGFLGVLAAYPAAEQAPESIKGIDGARIGMQKDAERRAQADAKAIADLQKSAGVPLTRAGALQGDLDKAGSQTAKAAGASVPAAAASAAQTGDIAALKDEVARLQSIASAYDAVTAAYSTYAAAEDKARQGAGAGAAIAAKAGLDIFLDDPSIQKAMPRMNERIGRLLQDYQNSLSSETLLGAAEIAIESSKLKTAQERQDYLDTQASRYAKANPELRDFIEKFRGIQ